MPYVIRKLPKKDEYKVYNKETKVVHSKHTTLANAKAQVRLLESKMNGEGVAGNNFRRNPDSPNAPVPLPIVGNILLNLPAYFIQKMADKKTKDGMKPYWKLVSPTTAVRNLSTRKRQNSLQIITGNKDEIPSLEYKENLQYPRMSYFSPKDQAKIKELFSNMLDVSGEFKNYTQKNKTRGLPEILPKNVAYHTERGSSKIKKVEFNTAGERLRNIVKGRQAPASAPAAARAEPEPAGGGGRQQGFSLINPEDLPQRPRPRAKTPTPRAKTPTPRARTPTPRARTPAQAQQDFGLMTPEDDYAPITPFTPFTPFSGRGILDDIKNAGIKTYDKSKEFINKVINPSSAVPPTLKAIKNEFGEENINSISVCRSPVPSTITTAMNIVSLGGFNKVFGSLPYDKLFHLYIVINTNKGEFLLEKNERINASKSIPNPQGLECRKVSLSSPLLVNSLLDNTERKMGSDFLPYSPSQNNCQDFITAILEANNLMTPELRSFVKQNTDEIFKQNPTLAKISRGLTDLGASVNVIQQGGKLEFNSVPMKIKYNHNNMVVFHHLIPQGEKQVKHSLGMIGGSIFDDIGSAFRSIPEKAKEVAKVIQIPTSVDELKSVAQTAQIPTDVAGAKRYGKLGLTYGLPAFGSALGGAAGTEAGGPVGGVVGATLGGVAGRLAAEQANKQIGDGLGRRKRGRPRKMSGGTAMMMPDGTVHYVNNFGMVDAKKLPKLPMSGGGPLSKLLDMSFTPREAIRAAKSVPALAREAVADVKGAGLKRRGRPKKMQGKGWFDSVLDTAFTPRQAIQLAKKVPDLAKEMGSDIEGAGLKKRRGRPRKAMSGSGIELPQPASVIGDMAGTGMMEDIVSKARSVVGMGVKGRPAKGSPEMKARMAKLRSMKKK
jgi:hypothetical protein